MRRIGLALALPALVVGAALAAEEVKSGLQPGQSGSSFNVRDITGPSAGKSLCYM